MYACAQQVPLYLRRARETSFQTKRALFMERLPPPQLTKNVFEIMVYLSYDRIGTVVEEANRICGHLAAESSNGADTASNGALGAVGPAHPDAAPTEARALVERTEPIGVDAYAAAIKALPDLPPELEELERFRPEVSAPDATCVSNFASPTFLACAFVPFLSCASLIPALQVDTPFPGTERRAISKAVGAARAAVKAAREGTPARKKKAATGVLRSLCCVHHLRPFSSCCRRCLRRG